MPNYRRYDRFAPATAALVRAPAYTRTRYTRCARNHISWTMERWTSDRKLCAWIFIRGAFPRQRDFFFFRRFPRTLANTTLIIWGSANQPRWLQLRASFAAVRCSRIRYPHLINFLRDLTLSCSNFFNFVPFADNGCLRNNFRLVFDSTFK